jgi:hypothetical protein
MVMWGMDIEADSSAAARAVQLDEENGATMFVVKRKGRVWRVDTAETGKR